MPRWHEVVDCYTGQRFKVNRRAQVHVDELTEDLIGPSGARYVGISNFALSTSRPAVTACDALEHGKEAFNLRSNPVDIMKIPILVRVEPFDELHEGVRAAGPDGRPSIALLAAAASHPLLKTANLSPVGS